MVYHIPPPVGSSHERKLPSVFLLLLLRDKMLPLQSTSEILPQRFPLTKWAICVPWKEFDLGPFKFESAREFLSWCASSQSESGNVLGNREPTA